MKEVTDKNFGVLIAFWIPGALLLWGLSLSWSDLELWFKSSESGGATVGTFLFASLASLATGLLISAIRWLVVDHFLEGCGRFVSRLSGLKRPPLDLSPLADKDVLAAFNGAVENHYRYYQYYSNTFVAVAIAFIVYASKNDVWVSKLAMYVVLIGFTLLLAAGDSLSKYYKAATQILKGKTHDKRLGSSEGGEDNSRQEDGEEDFQEGGL